MYNEVPPVQLLGYAHIMMGTVLMLGICIQIQPAASVYPAEVVLMHVDK